jgi:hypothetical protein
MENQSTFIIVCMCIHVEQLIQDKLNTSGLRYERGKKRGGFLGDS